MRVSRRVISAILWALAVPVTGFCGVIYDVVTDFSITGNPNGVWGYGRESALNGTFTQYTNSGTHSGTTIEFWDYSTASMGVGVESVSSLPRYCGLRTC